MKCSANQRQGQSRVAVFLASMEDDDQPELRRKLDVEGISRASWSSMVTTDVVVQPQTNGKSTTNTE